jgi:hypothetical protein
MVLHTNRSPIVAKAYDRCDVLMRTGPHKIMLVSGVLYSNILNGTSA